MKKLNMILSLSLLILLCACSSTTSENLENQNNEENIVISNIKMEYEEFMSKKTDDNDMDLILRIDDWECRPHSTFGDCFDNEFNVEYQGKKISDYEIVEFNDDIVLTKTSGNSLRIKTKKTGEMPFGIIYQDKYYDFHLYNDESSAHGDGLITVKAGYGNVANQGCNLLGDYEEFYLHVYYDDEIIDDFSYSSKYNNVELEMVNDFLHVTFNCYGEDEIEIKYKDSTYTALVWHEEHELGTWPIVSADIDFYLINGNGRKMYPGQDTGVVSNSISFKAYYNEKEFSNFKVEVDSGLKCDKLGNEISLTYDVSTPQKYYIVFNGLRLSYMLYRPDL